MRGWASLVSAIKRASSDLQGLVGHLRRKAKEPLSHEELVEVLEVLRALGAE